MAEAKNNYANIEKINTLLGADGIGALLKNVQGTEKKVNEILRKISDLENAARRRVQEEAALEEAAAQTAGACFGYRARSRRSAGRGDPCTASRAGR